MNESHAVQSVNPTTWPTLISSGTQMTASGSSSAIHAAPASARARRPPPGSSAGVVDGAAASRAWPASGVILVVVDELGHHVDHRRGDLVRLRHVVRQAQHHRLLFTASSAPPRRSRCPSDQAGPRQVDVGAHRDRAGDLRIHLLTFFCITSLASSCWPACKSASLRCQKIKASAFRTKRGLPLSCGAGRSMSSSLAAETLDDALRPAAHQEHADVALDELGQVHGVVLAAVVGSIQPAILRGCSKAASTSGPFSASGSSSMTALR